jgi:CIC family chloride channel protein
MFSQSKWWPYVNPLRRLTLYFDEQEQRLVVRAVVIGIVVWAFVFALRASVHWLFEQVIHLVNASPSLLFILIPLFLGAIFVAWLAKKSASVVHYRDNQGHIHELLDIEGDGLERAIALYYSSEPTMEQALTGQEGVDVRWQLPTFTLALRKFVASLATLGSGGSGGLEASVTLMGESLAAALLKPRRLYQRAQVRILILNRFWRWWESTDPDDLQTAQLCGIAAAVSTLLGAPFTAGFFAIEVMYRRRPIIEKLVYALISALVAFFMTRFTSGRTSVFHIEELYVPPGDAQYYLVVILMAIVISFVSIYFARLRVFIDNLFHHHVPNIWQRHLLGAGLTGLIAIAVAWFTSARGMSDLGLELVLGTGESAIDAALAGELTLMVAVIALATKLLATLITVGSGGSAGLLIPSMFFGTMVAAAFSQLFGYPQAMVLIVPAITASLVSIVNVPLAAILLSVELFSSHYMIPALLTLIVTAIFAHDHNIYRTQRQTFDRRQILPGYGVRRVAVPSAWAGQNLVELNVRRRFDITVIGLVEQNQADGQPVQNMSFNPSVMRPLEAGDTLIVLGKDENLAAFDAAARGMGG